MSEAIARRADHGFIDVNAQIGPLRGRAGGAAPEFLASELASHGVGRALVRHRTAILGEATVGNNLVLEAAQADPRLVPVAALGVDRSDEYQQRPDVFGSRVAAFWLESRGPVSGSAPIEGVDAENLLRAAARHGKPIFIVLGPWGTSSEIGRATADLGVPIVLVGSHYNTSVEDVAAAVRYPHLHLETSRMAHLDAVDTVVREIGHERLLFGSGAPLRALQSPLNAILAAHIGDDHKRAILAGNAQRLFGLPAGAPVVLPPIWKPARSIDVHTHFGPLPWDATDVASRDLLPLLAAENNSVGAVASSIFAIAADTEAGNAHAVEVAGEGTGQVAYLVADPNDIETTREQIRRWGDAPGVVGAKVHCQWAERLTGAREIAAVFEVLASYGKPVKIHNDGADWHHRLLEIANRHPKLPIVIAHGGLGYPMPEAAALTVEADNIYLEMCSSFAQPIASVRDMVRVMPRHKFMFGTDAPLLDPSFVLGTYQDAAIPDDRQDDVYYGNAARLYGLD